MELGLDEKINFIPCINHNKYVTIPIVGIKTRNLTSKNNKKGKENDTWTVGKNEWARCACAP